MIGFDNIQLSRIHSTAYDREFAAGRDCEGRRARQALLHSREKGSNKPLMGEEICSSTFDGAAQFNGSRADKALLKTTSFS